jgi:precorrin isomerase
MGSFYSFSTVLEEIYSESLCSRRISRTQLHQLQSLIQEPSLQPQQNRLIKRLIHASRRGWLNIVD